MKDLLRIAGVTLTAAELPVVEQGSCRDAACDSFAFSFDVRRHQCGRADSNKVTIPHKKIRMWH